MEAYKDTEIEDDTYAKINTYIEKDRQDIDEDIEEYIDT